MTENEATRLREKLEQQHDEKHRDIDKEQLRQRNAIQQLEISDGKQAEDIHDHRKAIEAIGKKLDDTRDRLEKEEVFVMAKRVKILLMAALLGGAGILGDMLLAAIRRGSQ